MPYEEVNARDLLRHSLATIAYRAGKIVRDAPQGYVDFQAGKNCRTPVQILAHIGDLLNHVGQLAILRRLSGVPIRGENYYKADIAAGRIGKDQPPPKFEFD